MHYNHPIDMVLHPRNHINAFLHIKLYVVLSSTGSTHVLLLALTGVSLGLEGWEETLRVQWGGRAISY